MKVAITIAVISLAAILGLNCIAGDEGTPQNPDNPPAAADNPPAKTFDERLADATKTIDGEDVLLSDTAAKALDDLAATAKVEDIPLLTEKLKETSNEALVAGLVLARLAQKHEEALDVLVTASRAGSSTARIAIVHMEPSAARKAGLAILKENAPWEYRTIGAYLLAIVGKKEDIPVLQKVMDEGGPLLADSCRMELEELQYKVEKVATAEQEAQWERAGLEYLCIARIAGNRYLGRVPWSDIAKAANSKGRAQLPIEYLRFKIMRREIFAVALAGFQKEPELIADLEKIATGDGTSVLSGMDNPSLLAMWALAEIGTEDAVNASIRASTTWKNTDIQHFDIARYAAEKGGPTTLPILKDLAEDEQLTEEVRKLYRDAAERLSQRLESPPTPPANGGTPLPSEGNIYSPPDEAAPVEPARPVESETPRPPEGPAPPTASETRSETGFQWYIPGIIILVVGTAAAFVIVRMRRK